MSDSFTSSTPSTTPRPPSRRVILWDELERLHERRLMDPPTATLTLEDLEAEVERLRQLLAGIHESSDA
jgi:hypothetical protein